MTIVVFENEWSSVKGGFQSSNLLDFDDALDFTVYARAQDADWEKVLKANLVIVDLDLSSKSEADGYSVIEQFFKRSGSDKNELKRIVVLTGNNFAMSRLKERGIDTNHLSVLLKPVDHSQITFVLKQKLET